MPIHIQREFDTNISRGDFYARRAEAAANRGDYKSCVNFNETAAQYYGLAERIAQAAMHVG